MTRWILLTLLLLAAMLTPFSCRKAEVKVASKKFTESVILGEMLKGLSKNEGRVTVHSQQLGGTKLVYASLKNGSIDAYVDYTGTVIEEIFANKNVQSEAEMERLLSKEGILVSKSLGFNNRYEIGMKREMADRLGIKTISDLRKHPNLRLGFGNEFLDRADGWIPLKAHYGLPHTDVRGMDHDIAYRQLDSNAIQVMDVYTTDAKVKQYDVVRLIDDRNFFPKYDAVILFRADLKDRYPEVAEAFLQLEGRIDADEMMAMNAKASAKDNPLPESQVAADFLESEFDIKSQAPRQTVWTRLIKNTLSHIDLVRKSLLPAILFAIPLGVIASKYRRTGQVVMAGVGIIQTIPGLALLVFLLAPVHALGLSSVGQGSFTAVAALFLYSLLPIVRNTYAGLNGISPDYHESAVALGLPVFARLRLVELPMASRTILEGIKTAAVINVGFATLGALIGAGGYGQPILTGIRLNNNSLILEGAIPAAAMALLIQWGFDFAERFLVPEGLRLESEA